MYVSQFDITWLELFNFKLLSNLNRIISFNLQFFKCIRETKTVLFSYAISNIQKNHKIELEIP